MPITFRLGQASTGFTRHEPLAKALETLQFNFERLLPLVTVATLLAQPDYPRPYFTMPAEDEDPILASHISKLASFLAGTGQVWQLDASLVNDTKNKRHTDWSQQASIITKLLFNLDTVAKRSRDSIQYMLSGPSSFWHTLDDRDLWPPTALFDIRC